MRRKGPVAATFAALAGGTLALVLGACGSGTSSSSTRASSGASPPCLPGTLEHTAALPGADVDVSPAPATAPPTRTPRSASWAGSGGDPRGVRSGLAQRRPFRHLRAYSQGDGASFAPDTPFDAGERVSVCALIGPHGRERHVGFGFGVDTPYPTGGVPEFHNPPAAPADYQSFYTLPGVQAPILTVTVPDHDPAAGDILTTSGPGPGQYGPLIYTPTGRLVWFDRLSGGEAATDLSEQTYAGRRVLTWWKGRVLSLGFGQGEDIVMNSHYQVVARVAGGNGLHADLHDFQIARNDIAYITAYNPIRCDLSPAGGASGGAIVDTAIQEIDMQTGLVRWEWHSLDHVGVAESEVQAPTDTMPWDYFHLNSIDPEPDGDILISARSTWAGYQLQRGTGRVLWRLGGNRSSFKMGPGTSMAWQHDGRVLPDGEVTFFDDGSNPPIHRQSRGLRIRLDFKTHEARLASAYTHRDPPLLAASQGNMQTLPDREHRRGLRRGARDQRVRHEWRVDLRRPSAVRHVLLPGVSLSLERTPAEPARRPRRPERHGEETIVHASWNGATDVSSWRVLAGKHPGSLTAQATIGASGFESSTTLPQKYAYVAVLALDSAGRLLGTSRTVSVISYAASLPNPRGPG